ncbi:MAG: hypothetical protein EA386_02085 [Rhodobacteraceae bacterium]|nr:MAG: hypothetical protein EA386_02085 [Paracoccaceae bacterium]
MNCAATCCSATPAPRLPRHPRRMQTRSRRCSCRSAGAAAPSPRCPISPRSRLAPNPAPNRHPSHPKP